jgi:hypothetical protein
LAVRTTTVPVPESMVGVVAGPVDALGPADGLGEAAWTPPPDAARISRPHSASGTMRTNRMM